MEKVFSWHIPANIDKTFSLKGFLGRFYPGSDQQSDLYDKTLFLARPVVILLF